MSILEVLRIFFGSVFILFMPGVAWSYIFFARKNIDWIERIALSFGLSIALVPIFVFWLNWLFQVKITLLNTFLIVCGLIAVPAVYILIKRPSWIKNATSRLRSALRSDRAKQP